MQSMTGFGRAEGTAGRLQVVFEVRSVNHRHLDLRFRLPPLLAPFESDLSECVREHFARGAFEIHIRTKPLAGSTAATGGTRFTLDEGALSSLLQVCAQISKYPGVKGSAEISWLANHPRIVLSSEEADSGPELLPSLKTIFVQALAELKKMRAREGVSLAACLNQLLSELESQKETITRLAAGQPQLVGERLKQRLAQWNLTAHLDAQRLEQEIVLFAERADITEELDRLGSHLAQFKELLELKQPVGRKLDFLTQELYREMNTIGSKAAATEIVQRVVDAKTSIEKLREQLQNVE